MVGMAILLSSCKKGVPDISSLRELEGFSLNQNSISISDKVSPSFAISGQCQRIYSGIEISIDGGKEWKSLSSFSLSHSINCSVNGTFSANLSFANQPLESSGWSSSGVYHLLRFRGVSELGPSKSISLLLSKQSFGIGRITAGASNSTMTGGSYRLKGQVTSLTSAPVLSGGNYKMQGEVLW